MQNRKVTLYLDDEAMAALEARAAADERAVSAMARRLLLAALSPTSAPPAQGTTPPRLLSYREQLAASREKKPSS